MWAPHLVLLVCGRSHQVGGRPIGGQGSLRPHLQCTRPSFRTPHLQHVVQLAFVVPRIFVGDGATPPDSKVPNLLLPVKGQRRAAAAAFGWNSRLTGEGRSPDRMGRSPDRMQTGQLRAICAKSACSRWRRNFSTTPLPSRGCWTE